MVEKRPIVVAGKTGQLARCLVDVARQRAPAVIAVGRPNFDLEKRGHRVPVLEAIATVDYSTPVKRPANLRSDCGKIQRVFGLRLPLWSTPLGACLDVLAASRQEVQSC